MEFGYKQALAFLPPWARGVQVFINSSIQHGTGPVETFQDITPLTPSWGVSLSRSRFSLRANWNIRVVNGVARPGATLT